MKPDPSDPISASKRFESWTNLPGLLHPTLPGHCHSEPRLRQRRHPLEPDSQPTTQSADTEALYIFSPHHESTACYLYQPKDSQSTDMYEVEHVSVEVMDSGRLAYLIAVSDQDDVVDTLKFRSTPREIKAQPGPIMQTPKADRFPTQQHG